MRNCQKSNEIWKKVSNFIKKGFNSEPVCIEKYLKTKVRSQEGKNNPKFESDKIPKKGSQCICVSIILIDLVYRISKNYDPQVFLEER